ncbi:TRAP transporter small permease [Achromobacter insolitus]|jgi:TRAP-type C4-dicarboxylate transport system permease small subunit|uniref:TRAP transporter small permease subunit n=1 Tax=Achromobacter TaxID=222 RepID=UPI0005369A67|nr:MULTISPECIES: TRAP transporter small permease [Achromobacter]APX74633.1 C4-dicarboxylate ABC transporter permease [Achromobacter insolitus]AVG39517.1 TRAP transporter small permease [Achromobacter insolitus]AXA70203.1 TRAP transporter small permease [Achromobacter insolitus]MCP1403146.1 TRAP-type C4-dicarboxylate transport system permease small subunit [Achromobacter insolitus]MDH3064477.1 TRAP transporter small permease [Achromobacter insolitus]
MTQSEHFRLLGGLLRRAESFSRLAVWAGGGLTVASVLLISFDVLARKFLGFTTGGADELSSYAFAISTSWALAFATLQRANVRVDVVYQYMPVRIAAVLDWISMVALSVFMVYLTYYAFEVVQTSWAQKSAANTPLATPLWIPQGLWALGLAWMCVTVALMLARASAALVTGDVELVKSICGVRSAQEEADEEAAAGERMVKGETA